MIVVRGARGAKVNGLAGDDRICGGGGPDRLAGGAGDDTLSGGRGRDRLIGGLGKDQFVRGPGDRTDAVAGERVNGRKLRLVAKRRPGTVEPSVADVVNVTGDPEAVQTVVLSRGAVVPKRGEVLVVPVGRRTPTGLLGRVTAVRKGPKRTMVVSLRRASLSDAYKDFSVSATGTLGDGAKGSTRGARAAASTGTPLTAAFDCKSGSGIGPTVAVNVDLNKLRFIVELQTLSPYLEVFVYGSPEFSLSFAFHGQVTCTAKRRAPISIPIPGTPLTVNMRPAFSFGADGGISANAKWAPRIAYGFIRSRNQGNADFKVFVSTGGFGFEGEGKLDAFIGLNMELALAGRIGVGGTFGPVLAGQLQFLPQRCFTVDAALRGQLTASANVFFKDWTFALASVTFGNWELFRRCAGMGGGSGGGGGASGGPNPSPSGGDAPPSDRPLAPANQVSVDSFGRPGSGSSQSARISRDGRYVWFESEANLAGGPMSQTQAVFVRDLVARTTRRIDPYAAEPRQAYTLSAISPNGRYAVVGDYNGRFRVDGSTGSMTPLGFSNSNDVGITNDGATVLLGFTLHDVATGQNTNLSCPDGSQPSFSGTPDVRIDNARFASVVTDNCRSQYSGYLVDLTTNTVSEVMRARCFWNAGDACVSELAVSDDATHFVGVRSLSPSERGESGEVGAFYDDSRQLPELEGTFFNPPRLCGVTAAGDHAVFAHNGLYDYSAAANITVTLPQGGEGNPVTARCSPQSVTANGRVVYTRSSTDSSSSQVFVDGPLGP